MANGLGHHIWNVPVPEIHRFGKVDFTRSPIILPQALDLQSLDLIRPPKGQRTSTRVH